MDQVVVHHCEKDKVDRECAEEEEKVGDQTTTRENDEQLFKKGHTSRHKVVLSHTQENVQRARGTVSCLKAPTACAATTSLFFCGRHL